MRTAYLDHAASSPIAPEVRAAMEPWLGEGFANPSSRHGPGARAREALEEARRALAAVVGADPERLVLCSGGTEANNLGVLGQARARVRHGRHVVLGPTEHASVRAPAELLREEGFEVESARLDARGELDLEDLASRLRADTVLVAQMLVSNELGTIYPVQRVSRLVRARAPRAALHVDAVQALGKLEVSLADLGATSVAFSAHKLQGPKGAGALALARGAPLPRPILVGGGQEHGLRAGTENVAAQVGFAKAAELAEARRAVSALQLEQLAAHFRAGLERIPALTVLEAGARRSPAIVAVAVDGPPAEVLLHHLDALGVFAGAGSACQAKKRELSPALLALGLEPERARRVLRFSFGPPTTRAELDHALDALERTLRALETVRG